MTDLIAKLTEAPTPITVINDFDVPWLTLSKPKFPRVPKKSMKYQADDSEGSGDDEGSDDDNEGESSGDDDSGEEEKDDTGSEGSKSKESEKGSEDDDDDGSQKGKKKAKGKKMLGFMTSGYNK